MSSYVHRGDDNDQHGGGRCGGLGVQARQGSGRMVAGLAPVVAVLVLISAVIDVYRVLQRCVRPSRGPPRGLSLATGSGVDEG